MNITDKYCRCNGTGAIPHGGAPGSPDSLELCSCRPTRKDTVITERQDISVIASGYSMIVFQPLSPDGRAWLDENLQTESWQWMGSSVGVDRRYAGAIIDGMRDDGLEVR
jgi:hypothetical protein